MQTDRHRRVALGDLLSRSARRTPEKSAIIDRESGEKVTYRELNEAVNRFANALLASGFDAGDNIALLATNSLKFVQAEFGIYKAGMVAVHINHELPPEDIAYQLTHSESDVNAVIIDADIRDKIGAYEDSNDLDEIILISGSSEGTGYSFNDFTDRGDTEEPDAKVNRDDPCTVMFTSGTTSRPKGVVHDHQSKHFQLMNKIAQMGVRHTDVQATVNPLYHQHAAQALQSALCRSATVLLYDGYEPNTLIADIETYEVTILQFLTPMYREIMDHEEAETRDLSSVRICFITAGIDFTHELTDFFDGAELTTAFGQTENGPMAILEPEFAAEKGSTFVGWCGAFSEVAVMDDEGNLLPQGEEGEIVVRSPAVMAGYTNKDTEEVLRNGWQRTEDIGFLDEEGQLKFVDRLKDIIKTGGENVSAQKVEGVVVQHPAVEEVSVIGLSHSRWVEAVTAVVVQKTTEADAEDIIQFARERLSGFETPKDVIFMEELPHSNLDIKVNKAQLVDQFADHYDSDA